MNGWGRATRGDLVYIETRLNNDTYRVVGKKWVAPTDTAVLDPVPSHPRQRPARRLITLITCDPATHPRPGGGYWP